MTVEINSTRRPCVSTGHGKPNLNLPISDNIASSYPARANSSELNTQTLVSNSPSNNLIRPPRTELLDDSVSLLWSPENWEHGSIQRVANPLELRTEKCDCNPVITVGADLQETKPHLSTLPGYVSSKEYIMLSLNLGLHKVS